MTLAILNGPGAPPLHKSESAYQASSEAIARSVGLLVLAPVITLAFWLDEVYLGWGMCALVGLLAAALGRRLSERLFPTFQTYFQKTTGLNYTLIQHGTIESGGEPLLRFLEGNNVARWKRSRQIANSLTLLELLTAGVVMSVMTVLYLHGQQVTLSEIDLMGTPQLGLRLEATEMPGESTNNVLAPARKLIQPEPRVIPIDPTIGARVLADVLTATLPNLRTLERDIRATKEAVEGAGREPHMTTEAANKLRQTALEADKLARDPNVSPELQKRLEEYSQAASETADAMDTAASDPESSNDVKRADGKKVEHSERADQVQQAAAEERAKQELVEQQLTGSKGGLSQHSKDLAARSTRGDPAARMKLQRQIEKDLRQGQVTARYQPPSDEAGGGPGSGEGRPRAGEQLPYQPSLQAGHRRDGNIDGKTQKRLTQSDRGLGQDGSSVDR
jgi:hypothetical protein